MLSSLNERHNSSHGRQSVECAVAGDPVPLGFSPSRKQSHGLAGLLLNIARTASATILATGAARGTRLREESSPVGDDTNGLCRPYGAWFFLPNNPRAAPVAKIVSPLRGFFGQQPLTPVARIISPLRG